MKESYEELVEFLNFMDMNEYESKWVDWQDENMVVGEFYRDGDLKKY